MINVVIPSYNQAQYLPDCIDSVLSQTLRPHRIIVVDDGSTDGSLEIAKKYAEENHIIKVISQVNKGLSSARNTGIMNTFENDCEGDDLSPSYVLFLDADDVLVEGCIKRIQQEIDRTEADIIAPSFKCFGRAQDTIILMKNPTIEDFKVANRIGYCSAVKRSRLLEVGGYSPRMTTGYEDLHLWFNLLSRGATLVTIPEILWLYRTKDKSMYHDALEHHEELMAQIRKDFPEVTNIINDPLPK